MVLVDRVEAIAHRKGVNRGQLALAWVLSKGDDLVPIPGTKRRKYLEENAAAVNINLTPAEIAELEAAVPQNRCRRPLQRSWPQDHRPLTSHS